jgi:isoamylase
MSHQIDTGANHPLGAAPAGGRANFSLFSRPATRVESLFFDRADDTNPCRVVDLDLSAHRTYHYWHAYEAMITGQLYGFRVHGSASESVAP